MKFILKGGLWLYVNEDDPLFTFEADFGKDINFPLLSLDNISKYFLFHKLNR